MRQRLPILLSATALLVAVFGATPLDTLQGKRSKRPCRRSRRRRATRSSPETCRS
jgi:hypothetical protein